MNTISEFQEKQKRLSDRIKRLQASISEMKNNLTEKNIENKAQEIHSLEIQLSLTEKALENTQKQQREHEKLLNSKEYKNKQETFQKLQKQAQKETGEVFRNLVQLQKQASSAIKKVEELEQAFRKLETDKQKLAYSSPKMKQPFSWLYRLNAQLLWRLKQAEYIKDKLEV